MKLYICGWCGLPCDELGKNLSADEANKCDEYGGNVNGECCEHHGNYEERMRVTRDMAIDAGDLSLEGEFI